MELTKVLEKGVALGYLNFNKNVNKGGADAKGSNENLKESWSLSNEVAKVIETGVALGFNFNGKVEMAAAEILRREKEDEARVLPTK